ncbi:MAG: SdiA-regulated domain-containing protein [Phycisphaerae bacterium]|nr:SdiA-regulated domain-containing protein [Phycisphaerae bacterium]
MCIGRNNVICIAALCIILSGGCKKALGPERTYLDIVFPNKWVGDIDKIGFNEPSGICWHSARGTLFVVGDEGDICEIKTNGELIKQAHIRQADFEGITYDPSSGLLYLAVEEEEAIVEMHPETFEVLREWSVPRKFRGRTLLRKGGEGFEGITFVPDANHKEGGIFHVANQAFTLTNKEDISAIFQVELPLRSGAGEAKILGYFEPGVIDLAGLNYDAATGTILVISDSANLLLVYSLDYKLLDFYAFPGDNQEGVTVDADGFIYIAQDTGGILKMKWLR